MLETLLSTMKIACADFRNRISNVRWHELGIAFEIDGHPYTGILRGRNSDLVLGGGLQQDAGIALRIFLDGDALAAQGIPSPSGRGGCQKRAMKEATDG